MFLILCNFTVDYKNIDLSTLYITPNFAFLGLLNMEITGEKGSNMPPLTVQWGKMGPLTEEY